MRNREMTARIKKRMDAIKQITTLRHYIQDAGLQ